MRELFKVLPEHFIPQGPSSLRSPKMPASATPVCPIGRRSSSTQHDRGARVLALGCKRFTSGFRDLGFTALASLEFRDLVLRVWRLGLKVFFG